MLRILRWLAVERMLLRKAVFGDLDELAALARRAVLGLSSGFYDSDQARSASDCITAPDTDLIADQTLFVAIVENRIVGCGGWSKRRKLYTGSAPAEGPCDWLDPETRPARIRAFFVDPNFARRGIARALYEACRDQALEAGFKRFELMATLPGVPFYENLGFISEGATNLELVDGKSLPAVGMGITLTD